MKLFRSIIFIVIIGMAHNSALGFDYDDPQAYDIGGAVNALSPSNAVTDSWVQRTCNGCTMAFSAFFNSVSAADDFISVIASEGYTVASGCNASYSGWIQRGNRRKGNGCGYDFITVYYTTNTALWEAIPDPDSDSDGWCDDCDYASGDASNPLFDITSYQTYTPGGTDYSFVVAKLSNGNIVQYGTYDSNKAEYIDITQAWRDQSQIENLGICTCGTGGTTGIGNVAPATDSSVPSGIVYNDGSEPNTYNTQDGVDDDGLSIDSDKLTKIVNNTAGISNNQQVISDQLNDIKNAIQEGNSQTGILLGSGSTGSETSGNDDVTSKLQEIEDAETNQGNSELSDLESDLSGIDGGEYNGDIPTGETIPGEDSISGFFDSFIANNPVSTYINNSGVTTSGDVCSLSWDYKGTPIDFTICNFSDELFQFGIIVNGLFALTAFMIIFRRS